MIRDAIAWLGAMTIELIIDLGRASILLGRMLYPDLSPKRFSAWVRQIYNIGFLSLVIIVVSALFIGMVLGLQGHTILARFGADQALGQLIALSLVRELSPVVSALLFAGRAGSALTAEIGLMKATEQLSALEMMGVDPVRRILAPRLWAGFISLPLLCMIFSCAAIYGGYVVGVQCLHVSAGAFWSNMQASVDIYLDVINGLLKSLVFGFVINWIALYQGYSCEENAEGISRATTKTVVYASLAILGLDFIMTAVMFGGFR